MTPDTTRKEFEMDESLAREGYEISNAMNHCPCHLIELKTDIRGEAYCDLCIFEKQFGEQMFVDLSV